MNKKIYFVKKMLTLFVALLSCICVNSKTLDLPLVEKTAFDTVIDGKKRIVIHYQQWRDYSSDN